MKDRDLDAKIAEDVYNWIPISIGNDANGENESVVLFRSLTHYDEMRQYLPLIGKIHRAYLVPQFTGDIDAAIDLAKHVGISLVYDLSVIDMDELPFKIAQWAYSRWKEMYVDNKTRLI